jgi:cytoskeletal protein CcmA (bactofilin family)
MSTLRRLLGLAEHGFSLGGFRSVAGGHATTVIGEGVTLKGELRGAGAVVVLGRFEGDIAVDGTITVGEGGYVDANISAGTIVIDGVVRGNLSADTRVEIGATGALTGSVKSAALSADTGATVKSEIWLERGEKPESTS